jgi:hypothetical protein
MFAAIRRASSRVEQLRTMSALSPKADIHGHDDHVRFVPIGDKVRRQQNGLFDCLIGAEQMGFAIDTH